VVGDGDDVEYHRSLATRNGVQERVRFLGSVSEEMLRAHYRQSDLFVLPSKGEGFGIVFLEAMFYRLPVVAGAHAGSLDIVEDGNTGLLVHHGDIDGLAAALIALLKDEGRRRRMGDAGYARLQERFMFPRFRDQLQALLRGVD
jgi:phosphatidylinositol alpha-1,6-mannosyltransferase